MAMRITAADVLNAGVTIQPEEAIAIAQQLIATFRSGACSEVVEPPFGPPTPDRVVLRADGSVVCRGCDTTPAVSEIAVLVEALLPPAPARVPGGLRYTIARALLDVDVAPFDSLDDLSQTLARYERGPRDQIVIRLLQRLAASQVLTPAAFAERRRPTQTTELRRALREAQVELYEQRRALPEGTSRPVTLKGVVVSSRSSRGRRVGAALAYVAAGAILTFTGEFIHRSSGDVPTPAIAAPAAVEHGSSTANPPSETTISDIAVKALSERRASPAELRPPSAGAAPARTASANRSSTRATRTTRPTPRVYPEPNARSGGKESVLDRLKLRWLRNVFIRPDNQRRSS